MGVSEHPSCCHCHHSGEKQQGQDNSQRGSHLLTLPSPPSSHQRRAVRPHVVCVRQLVGVYGRRRRFKKRAPWTTQNVTANTARVPPSAGYSPDGYGQLEPTGLTGAHSAQAAAGAMTPVRVEALLNAVNKQVLVPTSVTVPRSQVDLSRMLEATNQQHVPVPVGPSSTSGIPRTAGAAPAKSEPDTPAASRQLRPKRRADEATSCWTECQGWCQCCFQLCITCCDLFAHCFRCIKVTPLSVEREMKNMLEGIHTFADRYQGSRSYRLDIVSV